MSFDASSAGALDYFPCRYGQARILLRGPWQAVPADYVAALGGAGTYGRFVPEPWPARLEQACGLRVLNMGVPQAGPDAFLADQGLIQLARGARLRFLQLPGAINLTNRFYSVHPRRNDRFLRPSPLLSRLYPDLDFTAYSFTRHLIGALAAGGPDRFSEVAQALSEAWLDRMGALLQALSEPTVLVWFADRAPPPPGQVPQLVRGAPPLVDRGMIQALRPQVAGILNLVHADVRGSIDGKVFGPMEAAAAMELPGPAAHQAMADALAPWVRSYAA